MDRSCELPQIGEVDHEAGEFWVESPFQMRELGMNLSAYERNAVFLNHGDLTFVDASFASDSDIDSDSRSVVAADFDRDGGLDLLVGSDGGGPLRLFRNRRAAGGGHVHLRLMGTASNRSGIGARVVAHVGARRLVRDVWPRNGFQGSAPAELHLGLGAAPQIDRLEIRWPSGAVQRVETPVPAGESRTIVEPGETSAPRREAD